MSETVYLTAVTIALVLSVIIFMILRVVRQQRIVDSPLLISAWWETAVTLWNDELRQDRQMMQLFVAIAGVIISLSIGTIYGHNSWVTGWQLWTWFLTVSVMIVALMPRGRLFMKRPFTQILADYRWPFLITLLALLLRLPFLETVPGGLHIDEMGVAGYSALHIFPPDALTINPFHTGASSQPVLYHYLIRLSFSLFGYSIFGLRISSVLVGTAAILATYGVVVVFANRQTAVITIALLSTYHYHIHWSRIGLNNIWDTLWVPLVLFLFVWGYRRDWSGGAVLSGIALGLSQYFYAGSKIVLFMLPFMLWMLYKELPDRRRMLIHVGKLSVTAVAVGAPITLFALLEPDTFFARSRVVFGWQPAVIIDAIGELNFVKYFWYQVWRNFGAYTSVPEITGFYGPGVPFLIGIAAPLFIIGLLWAIWKRQWMPILWVLFTTIFGGMLLGGAPSSSHYVAVIPAICWLTAVPINWVWQQRGWKLAMLLLIIIMLTDLIFYFGVYVPAGPRDLINQIPTWPFP